MRVVGQFNLGFIIAALDRDLYIIDQHASDEKYRYEILQRSTTIHQQPLVKPLSLELTAIEEMVILDNLSVFEAHGFFFQINREAMTPHKVKLVSLPFSKHTLWGVQGTSSIYFS